MPALNRIILYTRRPDEMAEFYSRFFEFRAVRRDVDRIVELVPADGGAHLLLHPASKGQKMGQSLVKLVFDVPDVAAARDRLIGLGLKMGPLHDGGGYQFANAKDPSQNSIQISGRAFADLG